MLTAYWPRQVCSEHRSEGVAMTDLQTTVGAVIRKLRRDRRLTLRELARRAALSLVYLGEIERGQKYPSARVLEELSRALDLDMPDMLDQIATELRTVTLPVAQQPTGQPRSEPAKEYTPRATLTQELHVWQPEEVAIILMHGVFFQSAPDCNLRCPPQRVQPRGDLTGVAPARG